jgi:N-acyl-D-amino-acid deacylase
LQLRQPWMKVSTDAGGLDPAWAADGNPTHPRAYGTYPRVLGKYVREEGVIPLEDAVRKMTAAVAARLGLRERGLLRAGAYADVVTFDPATVADRATFADSHRLAVGVRDVWVNGARVLRDGAHTGATPGRIVNGPGRA